MDVYIKDYDTTVSFPDDTSPDTMKSALAKHFPKKEGFLDKVGNFLSEGVKASSKESDMMSDPDASAVATSLLGGLAAYPVSGLAGLGELLLPPITPKQIEAAAKGEGSEARAMKAIHGVQELPGKLITTPKQAEIA